MFFPVFVALYAWAHVFLWQVLASGLHLAVPARLALGLVLPILAVLPFGARRLERRGYARLARVSAWVGYTWSGLVLLFVLARLTADCALALWGLFTPQAPALAGPSGALFLTAGLTIALAGYAFVERSRVRIEFINVPTAKDVGGSHVRVAQISDVHIGSMNGQRRVRRLAARLASCHPDLIVSTGDLIDSRAGLAVPVTAVLASLKPPLGKFAVIGNHECYAGLSPALAFMERAGFTVLRNAAVSLPGINLAGMDDPAAEGGAQLAQREPRVLRAIPPETFTILLKHRPDLVPASQGRFDLQLSGHTHKGQIFPFGFLTRLYYPAHAGLFRLAQTSYLYVSRGTGAWGPPFRLFAPPEITVFDIGPGRPDPGGQMLPRILDAAYSASRETASAAPVAQSSR